MPGTFSKDNRPTRPGAYVNFEAVQQAVIPPSVGSIVALGFTHDWGPVERPVLVTSFSEWKAVYGSSEDTSGYRAARGAFQGEGVAGRGGAGGVLAYRLAGSAAAKATLTLSNTTPASSVTITARYEGSRGNDLRITVQDKAGDSSKTELIVLDGTLELERYEFDDTDITDLVAQINAASNWITAAQLLTGVALTAVSSSALTSGDDGSTLVSGDYTAMMTALEVERFGIIAFEDLTDAGIIASLKTWVNDLNVSGKRFMAVVGGAAGEDVGTAVVRSAALNSENFVNVGVGTYEDENLIDASTGDPYQLSTAQLAARVAGILAQRGEARSLTFARMAGLSIVVGPTNANVLTAYKGGVTVLSRDSNLEAPVRIEKGITTYTTTNNVNKPYAIYRTPKYIFTMAGIQNELQERAEAKVIGLLPVNNKTRDFVLGDTKELLASREAAGVIQPGWTAVIDPDPAPSDDDEFVAVLIGLRFGRSTEQVFYTIRVA